MIASASDTDAMANIRALSAGVLPICVPDINHVLDEQNWRRTGARPIVGPEESGFCLRRRADGADCASRMPSLR